MPDYRGGRHRGDHAANLASKRAGYHAGSRASRGRTARGPPRIRRYPAAGGDEVPVENVRGVNIEYEVIGDKGPWVSLMTGGRRARGEFVSLARKLAAHGFRVVVHDRRNTGGSDVSIEGEGTEEEMWSDDLHALLKKLGALPAFIGGSSSGARNSILFYLRHPEAVKALLLMRVTGGPSPAKR